MESFAEVDVASNCFEHFGFRAFDRKASVVGVADRCPVRDCRTELVDITYGKKRIRSAPYCRTHGLRLHKTTFVYWNGEAQSVEARLRNFDILPELAKKLIAPDSGKVETHRLGHEMSEDALSWNVFVGLAAAGKLCETVAHLTDMQISSEPELYLWGEQIKLDGTRGERFTPLLEARQSLERYGGRFKTEPDVILAIPGEMVVCIEAKFDSLNPQSSKRPSKAIDGLKSRPGLLERYLPKAATEMNSIFDRQMIDESKVHSQLFRNLVFSATMSKGTEWRVVNVACATDRGDRHSPKRSGANPEEDIRKYLKEGHKHRFTFRTWEGLHQALINGDSKLQTVDSYMRSKSAHFMRAFDLLQKADVGHQSS